MEQPDQAVECGLERALTVIKGKWKPTIIWLRASIPQPQPALPQPGVCGCQLACARKNASPDARAPVPA